MIKIRFFASLRERLGTDKINLEYTGEHTVADIQTQLFKRGEPWTLLRQDDVLCAVNQTLSEQTTRVNDGDEVAFFPPVTGG